MGTLKTEEGIVVEIEGHKAMVKAGRHAECENCGACPGSGSAIIAVQNDLGATIGQRVLFEIPEEQPVKGAFLIFVLPLLSIFAGAWLGGLICAALSVSVLLGRISGGVLLLALSAVLVKVLDKHHGRKHGTEPAIVRII